MAKSATTSPFPTEIILAAAETNTVVGSTGLNGNSGATDGSDGDHFTVTVPAGQRLTLSVQNFGFSGPDPGSSFIAYAPGAALSALIPTSIDAYALFDSTGLTWRDPGNAPINAPVLGPGTYAFWIQETVDTVVNYELNFVLSPSLPQFITYQGRIDDNNGLPSGQRQFKFALVDETGATTFWAHDGTTSGEPTTAINLGVNQGLFSVALGNTSLTGMTEALDPGIFDQGASVFLRIWYSSAAGNPFEQLSPDVRLTSVPYALNAVTADTANHRRHRHDGRDRRRRFDHRSQAGR